MQIEQKDLVYELAKRTIHNLEFMNHGATGQNESDPKVFEVTQLINSLLGLIVLPHELARGISAKRIECFRADEWAIPIPKGGGIELKDYIRRLRDAIAHGHIEFLPTIDLEPARIAQVRFGDRVDGDNENNFEVTFTIAEIEQFVKRFAGMIESLGRPNPRTKVAESIEISRGDKIDH
jgi:hypothetical protein